MSTLEFDHVSVTYARRVAGDDRMEEVPAVQDISFVLHDGEALGIAGESGSGKSTLALASLRLLPKTAKVSGKITIDGTDISALSWGKLRALRWTSESIVFQGAMNSLNPVQRIRDQIDEALRIHAKQLKKYASQEARDTRVRELMKEVGLSASKADVYPHQLSGGQRQRVMIAMALACEPQIIIADEPTTALDVIIQAQVLNLLKELVKRHGLSLIVITHDLSVLAETCERIMVMRHGKVIETGDSYQVMHHPRESYTRELAAAFPVIGDQTSRLSLPTYTPAQKDLEDFAKGKDEPEDAPIFQLQNLNVEFGSGVRRVKAVDDVTLDVFPHEIVALVGQSGSGKTTLARTMLGLQRPTSGNILYHGGPFPVGSDLHDFHRQVQFVLQDPSGSLNPHQTVYELVAEGPRIYRMDDEAKIVKQSLELAGLTPAEEYMGVLPQELSGGQRQRVVIAGALAMNPRFLIADEPVASLDASARASVLALFLKFKYELGMGSFIITHDLGLAWNIADRVIVMFEGKIVEDGKAQDVLLHPQHEYTRKLLSVVPSKLIEDGAIA